MAKTKGDLSRAFSEDGATKTHIGGQALIEGVMMRGKYNWAVGIREPDGGIYEEEHDLASGKDKNSWMYWPIIRGCTAMVESLVLGYKALEIAVMHAYAEEGDAAEADVAGDATADTTTDVTADTTTGAPTDAKDDAAEEHTFSWMDDFGNPDEIIDALGAQRKLEVVCEPASDSDVASEKPADKPKKDKKKSSSDKSSGEEVEFGSREMTISMVIGVVLGVAVFIFVPALLSNLIVGEYDWNPILWNIVDGILRVAIFIFYMWLIGRMKDIKRMFAYHGAEHKTIHCYEHGLPLTPENARQFPRLHVRCGTAFLIMVMIIAILVYTIIPLNLLIGALGVPDGALKFILVLCVRIIFLPLIAGIAYEITVKWAGTHPNNPVVKVILWPGMQMQYLTTNEPDDGMLECAIAAMKQVVAREDAEAQAQAAREEAQTTEAEKDATASAS